MRETNVCREGRGTPRAESTFQRQTRVSSVSDHLQATLNLTSRLAEDPSSFKTVRIAWGDEQNDSIPRRENEESMRSEEQSVPQQKTDFLIDELLKEYTKIGAEVYRRNENATES